jgi:hypothetical protein
VTAIHHVCLADELIDRACPRWVALEPIVGPGGEIVALQIAERTAIGCNDELGHVRILEIAAHELELLVRVAPPFHHMRRLEPAPDHRQVGGGHRAKLIAG